MTDTLTETEVTRIQNILMEQLEVRREQVTPEARIQEDLGADSLDVAEIAMTTEEAFNVTIPDEDAEKVVTVQDLFDTVGALLGRAR